MNSKTIMENLSYYFPNPKCELIYNKDYELVLAVMLSAQTTDKKVNEVTKEIFSKYDSLEKLNDLSIMQIEGFLKPLGFYHTKAKNFKSIVSSLLENNEINSRSYLESLPGVGRKTANVVLSQLYNIPSIAVDTHVARVSKRLGLASMDDNVEQIEEKLMKKFDKNDWNKLHSSLVLFGRYKCKSKNPDCTGCKFYDICTNTNKGEFNN